MTPREIIDKIKAHPAKERANEKLICDFAIHYLNIVLDSVEVNKKYNFNLKYSATNKERKDYFTGCFDESALTIPIIEQQIESLEKYKQDGNFGDLL